MVEKTLLRRYARLIARVGANIQKHQGVAVYASTEIRDFARLVVEEAYRAGAGRVTMMWRDQGIDKLACRHETLTELSGVPEWMLERQRFFNETLPAEIHLVSEDPEGLAGISQKKYAEARRRVGKIVKPLRDARENKHQWTIAGVPSPAWARRVFPGMRTSAAMEALWRAILASARVTKEGDPAEAWAAHNARLEALCGKLSACNFDCVTFKSQNGTDLKVWLIDGASWMGGTEETEAGVPFNPNIPTEEVFTTPRRGRVEGVAVATRPLSLYGQLIDNFSVTFKDGRVAACAAETGGELLERIVSMDEGASMLGEIALIGKSSPISQSGLLFYESLFDENAACHIALGMGFANALPDFASIPRDRWPENGVNDSMIHVDFMIGAPDTTVVGVTRDNKRVTLLRDGDWAI